MTISLTIGIYDKVIAKLRVVVDTCKSLILIISETVVTLGTLTSTFTTYDL